MQEEKSIYLYTSIIATQPAGMHLNFLKLVKWEKLLHLHIMHIITQQSEGHEPVKAANPL